MAYTDYRCSISGLRPLTSVLLIAFVLGLCACGGMTKKDASSPMTAEESAEGIETPIVLIPNPYLTQTINPPPEVKHLFDQAHVAMQAEDWSTANKLLTALTQSHPTFSGPFVNLGIVQRQQNQLEDAQASFEKAITTNPNNNDAYNQLGVLLREQGRFDEAEAIYKQALGVWPHAPQTLRNLGILYDLYMGKFDLALAQYELALRVSQEPSRELQGWIIDLKRRIAEANPQ